MHGGQTGEEAVPHGSTAPFLKVHVGMRMRVCVHSLCTYMCIHAYMRVCAVRCAGLLERTPVCCCRLRAMRFQVVEQCVLLRWST